MSSPSYSTHAEILRINSAADVAGAAHGKADAGGVQEVQSIYPEAVFPGVYFLIGVTSSGGTTGQSGLLIGTEMYGKTAKTPMEELSAWLKVVLSPVEQVPAIVAHEIASLQSAI